MRKTLLSAALLAGAVTFGAHAQQRECHTMEVHDRLLQEHPEMAQRQAQIEAHTQRLLEAQKYGRVMESAVTGVVTIPVVVHVVYNSSAQNVSDAQIQSQIDVLNEDFRKLNSDVSQVPSLFAGRTADSEIEFVLDQVVRVSTKKRSFGSNDDVKNPARGGSAAISPETKMNMWVCDLSNGLLGYAQFPGGPAATDGVVVDYAYFGRIGTATAPYGLGRTATHEVGHYLNLRHIWGDGGCSVDDFVSDTPVMGGSNGGCPSFGLNSCNEGAGDEPDMWMNYMDYVYDQCMYMFTEGQKSRMRALFEPGGARAAFAGNDGGTGGGNETCQAQGPDDVGRQAYVYYSVEVPAGATSLSVSISGSQGDADLYVKYGSQPTTTDNDCASESPDSNESCGIGSPAAGTWYVGVYGYRNSNGVTTDICYSVPARGTTSGDVTITKVGVVDHGAVDAVYVYPNPVQNVLKVNLGVEPAEGADLRVISISGKEMMRFPATDAKGGVDVSQLPEGMYILSVEDTKGGTFSQKFIKN